LCVQWTPSAMDYWDADFCNCCARSVPRSLSCDCAVQKRLNGSTSYLDGDSWRPRSPDSPTERVIRGHSKRPSTNYFDQLLNRAWPDVIKSNSVSMVRLSQKRLGMARIVNRSHRFSCQSAIHAYYDCNCCSAHLWRRTVFRGNGARTTLQPSPAMQTWWWWYLPLPTQPKLVLIRRPWRDGRLSWPRHHLGE